MKITANTTEAEILAPVTHAKSLLAEAAVDGKNSETLAGLVNDIAAAEGQAQVRATIARMLDRMVNGDLEPSAETLVGVLTRMLLAGPDDSWSGRTNDARRCRWDGMRREIEQYVMFNKMQTVLNDAFAAA